MADRYPLSMQIRGGTVPFLAENIFVTTNKFWKAFWPNVDNISAFERRIREFGSVTYVGTDKYPTAKSYMEDVLGIFEPYEDVVRAPAEEEDDDEIEVVSVTSAQSR